MHTLFVYGTLRKNESNSSFLSNSEFIGYDSIQGFIMLDFGEYPMIFESDKEDSIIIEIYRIDDYTLHHIDKLEDYSGEFSDENLYSRRVVKSASGMDGLIYMGEKRYKSSGIREIKSGDWINRKNNYF